MLDRSLTMTDRLRPTTDAAPPLFHLALRLEGQRCLVVGGGPIGTRKAESLASCGALVTVVAPEISPALERLGVKLKRRPYEASDLDGCRLAVAATGVPGVDRQVYADARERGVLVNAADDPEACEYLVPAVTRLGPVSVAVSTGGLTPYLAGWIKRRIGEVLTPEVGELRGLGRPLPVEPPGGRAVLRRRRVGRPGRRAAMAVPPRRPALGGRGGSRRLGGGRNKTPVGAVIS